MNRNINTLFTLITLLFVLTGAQSYTDDELDQYDEELLLLWDEHEEFLPKGFDKPPTASYESWEAVQSYLLPYNHPIRKILDQIFTANTRPLLSEKNMKKAGFFNYTQSDKGIIVTGHPRLKGYLIKAYLDTCYLEDWKLWLQRILGANQIRQSIEAFGYQAIMKTPKKWIYPLPRTSAPPTGEGFYPKHYILVVQDMGILSPGANEENWKHRVTPSLLDAFYNIAVTNGLVDSYYIDNSPFCFDKRIAFLDTEHFNADITQFPNRQNVLFNFLSKEMRSYWEYLIQNGGPP